MNSNNKKDIELFYERFNQLPEYYKLEKVHQLIHDPNAKATHRINLKFKPLKFIIMASVPIIFLAAYLSWPGTVKEDYVSIGPTSVEPVKETTEIILGKSNSDPEKVIKDKPSVSDPIQTMADNIRGEYLPNLTTNNGDGDIVVTDTVVEPDCFWPDDTLLDKHSLFIYLSNEELLKLGVELYSDSMYYSNNAPNGSKRSAMYNMKGDPLKFTQHNFELTHNSDTLCTRHHWGHRFYNEIDTLLPVVINISDEAMILWFTSHPDIFTALPERYSYLQGVYKQLICLRKKNPDRQYVNYWVKERNQVLDKINYLELTKEELGDIGIGIFKDSIRIVDATESFKYYFTDRKLDVGTWCCKDGQEVPEIPNLFPTLITDIKGLEQHTFGNWMKSSDSPQSAFNTLIPVLMPFSDYIKGRNYQYVYWYYPTEDFLNALPERYRNTLKAEIEYINTGISNENANCTYFEACKSTLQLDGLKVYPNPAAFNVTVEFSSDKATEGSISLVNISGAMIRDLVSQTEFQAGQNTFKCDLSGVSSGVYLVYIVTSEGFKTQRLIVSD